VPSSRSPARAARPLTLPWVVVQHDNHRLMPARVGKAVRLITSPAYRHAKAVAETMLAAQWGEAPLAGAVTLVADVWMPDARKRDAGNYRKLITDALSGIAYRDDAQLVSETWRKSGIDRENPRVEIIVGAA
jgi:Holliday junction resolvase RusA-like endonuclease